MSFMFRAHREPRILRVYANFFLACRSRVNGAPELSLRMQPPMLAPDPNPVSLYLTQYITEDLIEHDNIQDVFGDDLAIYEQDKDGNSLGTFYNAFHQYRHRRRGNCYKEK